MGEALVFLPGLMCDARIFMAQLADLSRDHAVTVAPITRGERIEEIASNILDTLPQKFALCGLSMGGIVAMEILRRAPDRITRLALMDTNPLAETPQSASAYEPMIVGARAGRLNQVLLKILGPEHLAPTPHRMAIMSLLEEMAAGLGPEVFIRQVRALQRRRDQQATLRRCKVPTMVLCGEQDTLTPLKRHSFMAELIPNAELRVVADAGHLPVLEQPEVVNDAIRDWLRKPLVLH